MNCRWLCLDIAWDEVCKFCLAIVELLPQCRMLSLKSKGGDYNASYRPSGHYTEQLNRSWDCLQLCIMFYERDIERDVKKN